MKRLFILTTLLTSLLSTTVSADGGNQLLRHVVSFRFKENIGLGQQEQVRKAFLEMKRQIPYVVSIEAGYNNSSEGLTKGFSQVYIATFRNSQDRDRYVFNEPVHNHFKAMVGPLLADVFVFDFTPYARP
jgi:hypothetical protein